MRYPRIFLGGLACLVLLTASARTETPSPLRLLPDQAEIFVEIQKPRPFVDAFLELDLVDKLKKFPAVEEQLESTQVRRFYQLIAYFESELGAKWPELLDRLAGGGIALGSKVGGGNNNPALLAIQGKDAKLTAKFTELALKVLEQEFARQEVKLRPIREKYGDADVVQIGDGLFIGIIDDVILVSNKSKALQAGLDLYAGKTDKSIAKTDVVAKIEKLLPKDTLARFWLDMNAVRKNPQAADLYKRPREPFVTVILGEYIEMLAHTPFITAGFARQDDSLITTVRMPVGRDKMGPEKLLHLPPEGKPGTLPLLEPKGVMLSDSFYFNFASIWNDRVALFGEQAAKALEEADKNTKRIPVVRVQISKLLKNAGAYHRFVAVHQPKAAYSKQPKQPIPAAAFITQMGNPDEFARTAEALIRGGGLFLSNQYKLKYTSEEHKGYKIVGYRFSETEPLEGDPTDLRYNASPCFVRVKDQFVVSSTIELARELVDLLVAESKTKGASPAHTRTVLYAEGLAETLLAGEDQLITQAVLDQAVPIQEAQEQVREFIKLLKTAGTVRLESVIGTNDFRYDIRYQK